MPYKWLTPEGLWLKWYEAIEARDWAEALEIARVIQRI